MVFKSRVDPLSLPKDFDKPIESAAEAIEKGAQTYEYFVAKQALAESKIPGGSPSGNTIKTPII